MPGGHVIEHQLAEAAECFGPLRARLYALAKSDELGDQVLPFAQPAIDQFMNPTPAFLGVSASFQHVDLV